MRTRAERKLDREYAKAERKRHRLAVAQGDEEGKYYPNILTEIILLILATIVF